MFEFIGRLYTALAPKKNLLLVLTILVILVCGFRVAGLVVREDIRTMLPDGESRVVSDFELLQNAPFTRRMTITVSHPGGNPAEAAQLLAGALQGPVFPRVICGPGTDFSPHSLTGFIHKAPALLTRQDMPVLQEKTAPPHIRESLKDIFRMLVSPGGMALKQVFAMDPIGIRDLVLPKLAASSRLFNVRVENGVFVSNDGKHALVIAETEIPMTDSQGASKVMAAYTEALDALPPGATAILASGHRHTLANARTVKRDLRLILPVSLVLLAVLFCCFIRTRQGIFVFLVPVAVIGVAGIVTSVVYGGISGIVLGFGAVLLGISVDFAVHVFHALRQPDQSPAQVLVEVARPVIFGALTSCVAFASLFVSDIPGIRQLAFFSITGLAVSLFLSLVVLPHCITPASRSREPSPAISPGRRGNRRGIFLAWALILMTGIWAAAHTQINGDLRELGYVPQMVQADEDATRDIWGGMRDIAMVFALGATREQALEANDKVWEHVRANDMADRSISIAPILPSKKTQTDNITLWNNFWQSRTSATLASVDTASRTLGFSPTAFATFSTFITTPPEHITGQTLRKLGMSGILDMLMVPTGAGFSVLTLLPDTARASSLFSPQIEDGLNARFVSATRFREMLGQAMAADVLCFGTTAFAAIALFTVLLFRNLYQTALALLPVAGGVTAVLTIMYLAGQSLNLFHIVAIPLVMGLGADYGIFMVCRKDASLHHGTLKAVLFSALSTLAGFGALTLARHPALFSMGLTVLTGIATALIMALFVIPLLQGERR